MTTANTTYAELNAVLDRARRTSVTGTPVTDQQLLALQHRWTTALSARLDQAIEFAGAEPLTDSVAGAWHTLAADHATLRAVLDAHEATSPALAKAQRGEFLMLAMAAGLTGLDDRSERAVTIGRSLRDQIRTGRTELAVA
jgi:hypothetical protein